MQPSCANAETICACRADLLVMLKDLAGRSC